MKEINFNRMNINDFNKNEIEDYKVVIDGVDFYFKLHIKDGNDKLVIFSNGAIQPDKKKPPIFMRSKWYEEIEANCLYIDDRTIHENDLKIGWGIGTAHRHYIEDYHKIAVKVSSILNITSNNTTYYGSSAGGFMSILLATLNKGSQCIVNNPQIYVYNYNRIPVKKIFENVFPGRSKESIIKEYRERLAVPTFILNHNNTPRIYYYQNLSCKSDVQKHLAPFKKAIVNRKLAKKKISFTHYYDDFRGHNPIPKNSSIQIINMHINNNNLSFN